MNLDRVASADLTLDRIPPATASWQKISKFALTFDPKELPAYGASAGDVSNAGPTSSLAELRYHLYVEQRRWNHFGEAPDPQAMQHIRRVIELITLHLKE